MFLPERYRRNPPQRRPSLAAPEPPTADAIPAETDFDAKDGAWDDSDEEQLTDEEAELSDAEFYQSLRRDVAGCREGSIPSITDAMRPPIQNRPWSPRRKRRDRYGRAF